MRLVKTTLATIVLAITISGWANSGFEATTYLKAPNGSDGDRFGYAVAATEGLIVCGAPYESRSASGIDGLEGTALIDSSGAAHLFAFRGASWIHAAYMKAPSPSPDARFGEAVAADGSLIVVGAPGANDGAGAVYLYRWENDTLSLEATLSAADGDSGDQFGSSVSVNGDTVIVGAPLEDSNSRTINGNGDNNDAFHAGCAYVFVRIGGSWQQQAYLKASNADAGDRFGTSVSIVEDSVLVGAPNEKSTATGVGGDKTDNSSFRAGAAYLFSRSGDTWTEALYLKASNTDSGDQFGASVALDEGLIAIGAIEEESTSTGVNGDQSNNDESDIGAVYLFEETAGMWGQVGYLKPMAHPDGEIRTSRFGAAVSINGSLVVVGSSQGRVAHLFERLSNGWTPRGQMRRSELGSGTLTFSVAATDSFILVGDDFDESASAEVDGDISDTSGNNVGAAHIFERPSIRTQTQRPVDPLRITNLGTAAGGGNLLELDWNIEHGRRYMGLRSPDLRRWNAIDGFSPLSAGEFEVSSMEEREFFTVIDLDATSDDVDLELSPEAESVAISPDAAIMVRFYDDRQIDPNSIKLTVGDLGSFTLTSDELSFDNNLLTFTVPSGGLGSFESLVEVVLSVGESDGTVHQYEWSYEITPEPILVSNLVVFGSEEAQAAGQTLSAEERRIAQYLGVSLIPANSSASWNLAEVNSDRIVIQFDAEAPDIFELDQYLANTAPTKDHRVFYRKITAIETDAPLREITLFTDDAPLVEFIQQGGISMTGPNLSLVSDETGALQPYEADATPANDPGEPETFAEARMVSLAEERPESGLGDFRWALNPIGLNLSGQSIDTGITGLDLSFPELNLSVTPTFAGSILFKDWSVERLNLSSRVEVDAAIVAKLEYANSFLQQNSDIEFLERRRIVRRYFAVGSLPVLVDIYFGVGGATIARADVNGELRAGFRKKWVFTRELDYVRSGSAPPKMSPDNETFDSNYDQVGPELFIDGECLGFVAIQPQLDVEFYKTLGLTVRATGRLRANGSASLEGPPIALESAIANAEASFGVFAELTLDYTDIDNFWKDYQRSNLWKRSWCRVWDNENRRWQECIFPPSDGGGNEGTGSDGAAGL